MTLRTRQRNQRRLDDLIEQLLRDSQKGDRMTILDAADKQRAAQLLRYLNPAAPNIAAADQILEQAHHAGRGTQLLIAVAAIAYAAAPDLTSEAGQSGLAELALQQHELNKEEQP